MQEFIGKYRDQINGTLSGFDRLVFRGSLRRLNYGCWDQGLQSLVAQGMEQYLWQNHVLFKDYLDRVKHVSQKVKQASVQPFVEQGLPVEFLRNPAADKDEIARAFAAERAVSGGLVCALSSDEQVGWMYARIQPWFPFNRIFEHYPVSCYWTAYQTLLVRHGMLSFSIADVMRYFGRKVNQSGAIPANFKGTLETDLKRRQEGERVKYRMNGKSAGFYDKAYSEIGSVLRGAETTIKAVGDFRAFRPKEGGPEEDLQWRPLRKGIAHLHRRAEVSQKANDKLRLLRAHALIRKVPRTHRYQVTDTGRAILVAVVTAARTSVNQLNQLAKAA